MTTAIIIVVRRVRIDFPENRRRPLRHVRARTMRSAQYSRVCVCLLSLLLLYYSLYTASTELTIRHGIMYVCVA